MVLWAPGGSGLAEDTVTRTASRWSHASAPTPVGKLLATGMLRIMAVVWIIMRIRCRELPLVLAMILSFQIRIMFIVHALVVGLSSSDWESCALSDVHYRGDNL